jgi:hypothetical protein
VNDVFTATANQIALATAAGEKSKTRPPLTEEQKDALRQRLAVARAKRSEMSRAGLLKGKRPPKIKHLTPSEPLASATFTMWSDAEWRDSPYNTALQRLRDLTADRERGATLVQQRQTEEHIGNIYRCIVCKKLVPDGRWIWKNDRRDPLTQMWTSDVLCSQLCHERFSNNAKFYMDRAKGVS